MIRVVVPVAICVLLLARSGGADERGEALRAEGMRDYDAGRYDDAIAKLERAYSLTHARSILYALGQAKRRKGDCRGAIESFEQFVALAPPATAMGAARFQIARCLEQLAASGSTATPAAPTATPAAPPAPPTAPTALPAPPAPSTDLPPPAAAPSGDGPPRRERRWYRDAAGDALFGVGVGVGGAGVALLGTAEVQARHAGDNLQSFREAQDVTALRTAGIVLTSAGVVLLVAGVARWLVAGRSPQRGSAVPTNRALPSGPPPRTSAR